MSRDIDDRIAMLATPQHGVVARPQLLAAGLSRSAIGRRVRSGDLRPMHRGVYLTTAGPHNSAWAPEMAAVLASGSGVLSHLSAGSLWRVRRCWRSTDDLASEHTGWDRAHAITNGGRKGIGEINADQTFATGMVDGAQIRNPSDAEPVDVSVVGHHRGRRRGIRVHRVDRLDADERTARHGIPVTSPGRTLLDLAGMVGMRELEAAVARAERERLVTRQSLMALVERQKRRTGVCGLRAVLQAAGGPAFTRSEAEERFLALVREAGLPAPQCNVAVGRYEIDFLWRSAGIAVEVDGFHHHSSRPRFEGDRRKDAWLMARGILVIRLSWRQITRDRVSTATQVGQAIARAGASQRAR